MTRVSEFVSSGMTRRRLWRPAALAVTLSATAMGAACAVPGRTAEEAAPARKELRRGTKLGVMVKGGFYSEPQDAEVIQPALMQWQARTGVSVEAVDVGTSTFNEKLQVLLAAGTPPDLVSIGYSQDPFGILLRVNALAPLDPLVKRDRLDTSEYYPYALEHFRFRNSQWGLPMSTNPTVMFHNRDLLTRSGQQPPPSNWKAPNWTWSDLVAMAQPLTKRELDPGGNVYGTVGIDGIKMPAVAVWSYGGDLFDKDQTRCTLDSPQAIDALQMLVDLMHRYRVHPTPEELRGTASNALFNTGRAGLLGGGPGLEYVDRLKQAKPAFPWGIHVFPRGSAGRFSVTIGWALSLLKASRYPDEAWELAKYVGSKDFLRLVSREGRGGISPLKSVMADVVKATDLPNGFKEVIEATTEIRRYPILAQWAEISDVIIKQMNLAYQGTIPVRQVAADIVSQVTPMLRDRI